ncbi:NUDIX domain-containing protein [Cellulomonas sp.]|uniref:NUDIX domain-containing protein n=1 Tax=Cellulomonas sp. TaxID=40001 RepID=UPI003BADAFCA
MHGAAGLLLVRRAPDGSPQAVVLQHRALWSDQGGTWGVPGGARMPGETPEDAALREAAEEAGIDRQAVRLRESRVLQHPDWSYTTVIADEILPIHPAVTDAESVELRWVPLDQVTDLDLLPAFADAWPRLRERIEALGGR